MDASEGLENLGVFKLLEDVEGGAEASRKNCWILRDDGNAASEVGEAEGGDVWSRKGARKSRVERDEEGSKLTEPVD